MTKKELMIQKTQIILHEVARMSEAIKRMEDELRNPHPQLDFDRLIEQCEELRARLDDIRDVVSEARRKVIQPSEEIEEPDLWL